MPRRSTRLKNIHTIYDEDFDRDPSTFKRIKIEVIDSVEVASPSTSDLSAASVCDKDSEQDCHDVSLKDLRTQCKAKNRKTSKITLERFVIKNQTKTEEDFDLDKPLIALKLKRPKTSPAKANIKMDVLRSSPCAKEDDTTSQKDILNSAKSSLLKATVQDPVLEKLEQSKVAIGESLACSYEVRFLYHRILSRCVR